MPRSPPDGVEKPRIVAAFLVRPVVAGEKHNRVLVELQFLELGEQLADVRIQPA